MAMTYNMHIDLLLRPERSLILRTLLKNIIQQGMRVLDAGCGSGILSIWAAQFGAKEVVSVDMNDPDSQPPPTF